MKVALCVACFQVVVVVVVGVASGRSYSIQHLPSDSLQHHHLQSHQDHHLDSLQHHRPDFLQHHRPNSKANNQTSITAGKQHPAPHHPVIRGSDYLRMRSGNHKGGRGSVDVCGLCPAAEAIAPCMCQCLNETAAELICGPELLSCSQLTEVMCLTAYPVSSYLRLVVQNTELGCNLEKDLWGPLMFKEIVITNNRFQALDNRAFQPFSATLTALDLEGNSLRDVYFSTMSDTPLLRVLSLRNNNIEFLPGYSAMELALLETFDAAYNKITAVYPQTFAGMPKVRTIDLSNNVIKKVTASAFTITQHAGTSLYINLAHNLISSIEPMMLEGVRVCSIDLQDNRLTILSEKVFRPIIDFTGASAEFWTSNNPFDCDSQFCWIATNETVSGTFDIVLCPNLDNESLEVLAPMCSVSVTTAATRRRRKRPRFHPARFPPFPSSRKRKLLPAARNQRNSSLSLS